jgi:hypothetical protein
VEPLSCISLLTCKGAEGLCGGSIFLGLTRILFNIDQTSGAQIGSAHAAQVSCCGQIPQRTRGNMAG